MTNRCEWGDNEPLYIQYHDEEWGVPLHDDQKLFEFLILEGAQAGLSWITILKKRESYREAFDGFDANAIAKYDDAKVADLLSDPGIVRNKLKVRAAIQGANAYLSIQKEFGSFNDYIWSFTEGKTIKNRWREMGDIPALTPESQFMSKDLKRRGFNFVGPTICYAFMQATGIVNDHIVSCFRHNEVSM